MKLVKGEKLHYRMPTHADGASMWKLVRDSGSLDLNSSYCYILLGEWFSESCRVAEHPQQKHLLGIVTGFRQPSAPETLFVWQIAVDKSYRGQGIAMKLLDELIADPQIRYLEATISPSNLSSCRLFEKWAVSRNASVAVSKGFDETCFPDQCHEREQLYRIGPIKRLATGK